MSAQQLVQFSVIIEPVIAVLGAGGLIYWGIRHFRRRKLYSFLGEPLLSARLEDTLTPIREIRWLLAICGLALFMRVVGWNQGLTAPHWFSQVAPLWISKMFDQGTFGKEWIASLFRYQVYQDQNSAVMLPVAAFFQRLLGPSFHLPVLIGAFWGELTVILAWLVGRSIVSRTMGLFFAAFVAVSPLQLVWSRIGGIPIGGGAHILLTVAICYLVGKRRSCWLAILAAMLWWGCLYQYLSARVALALGPAAMLAGLNASRSSAIGFLKPGHGHDSSTLSPEGLSTGSDRTIPVSKFQAWRKPLLVIACFLFTLATIYVASGKPPLKETIWPYYGGYVGNNGEKSLTDLISKNKDNVKHELHRAASNYFFRDRSMAWETETPFKWGIENGGFCLIPVAVLGFYGLFCCLWRLNKHYFWLLFVGAGLALACFSVATARRMLIFDLAWCALAALGLSFLLQTPWFRRLSTRAATLFCALFLSGIGIWTFSTVMVLNANLKPVAAIPIPFGDAGFGDGITCLRCLEAGKSWQPLIDNNEFVILFSNDPMRENRTCPGGLPLYGKIAALAAGRKSHFLEFYALASNFDVEPTQVSRLFDPRDQDYVTYLRNQLSKADPASIVWHFEQPTLWERSLAELLRSAGGELTLFQTPLSADPGIIVRTPRERIAGALSIFRQLSKDFPPAGNTCFNFSMVNRAELQNTPLILAADEDTGSRDIPEWAIGSWNEAIYAKRLQVTGRVVAMNFFRGAGNPVLNLRLMTAHGTAVEYQTDNASNRRDVPTFNKEVGYGCAAYAASQWWIVDPVSGRIRSSSGEADWLPNGQWMGIAAAGENRLMLASANQRVHLFDLIQRKELLAFAAPVWPSVRYFRGECTPLAVGDKWYGVHDATLGRMSFYNLKGEHLKTLYLAQQLSVLSRDISSSNASGGFLGIGLMPGPQVITYSVNVDAACDGRTIVHALAIERPKAEGTPWNDPTNIIFDTQGIYINLGQRSHARRLEASLDNNDAYRIDFLLNDRLVGSLQVAKVLPGMGLALRTTGVPSSASEAGFDTLRVLPISGDGAYSLGHIRLR